MTKHRPDTGIANDIVVVDDSLDSLRYMTDILQKQGYRIRPAANGELALSAIAARRPDLILLDVKMPGMDGYEVCRRLKSDPENARVPIIFISALDEPEHKVKAFAAGGVDYITKPLNSEEVLARVQTHLRLQELAGRLEQLVVERTAELTRANKKLHETLEARKRDNELMNLRLKLIQYAAGHTLEDLMQTSLDEIEKLTGSKISFFHTVETDQKTLTLRACSTNTMDRFCKAEDIERHYDIDQAGVWGDCIRDRKPVIYNDAESRPHKKGLPHGHADVVRQLVVPIIRHDRIVSILGLGNKASHYTREDVQTAAYCADVVWEISKRKEAEQALALSEEKYSKAFNNSPVWVVLSILETGRYIEVNQTFLDSMGYTRDEVIGRTSMEVGLWENPDDRRIILETIREQGYIRNYEYRRRTRSGKVLTRLFSSEVIDFRGEACLLTVSQDISDRKAAEEKLRLSENNLSITLDSIGDAVITTDNSSIITRMNPTAEQLTGWPADEAVGRPLPDVMHIVDAATRESLESPTATVLAGIDIEGLAGDTLLLSRDGNEYLIADNGAPIRDDRGEIVGVVMVFRDITESYQQERKIRDSEKLLKHITANVPGVVYQFRSTLEHEYSMGFISEKVAEIFGLDPSPDNFFENFTQCIPESEREAFIASIQAAVDYVTPWYYEGRFIQPAGREMWFSGSSVPHKEGDDIVFDGVLLDITERIETTASLRLNEMRLEAMIELSQMADADIRRLTDFALEKAIKLTSSEIGYLAFTAEDEKILEMYSWSSEARRQCAIENQQNIFEVDQIGLWGEAIRQRRPIITNDYQAPGKDKKGYPAGHVPILRHMNIPVFDGERIVAIAGVGNKSSPYVESDVNQLTLLMQGMWQLLQRKQADEALRQSEDRFRRLFQQAPIPLMIVDADDRVQYLNDRFTEFYGYARDDIPTLDAFWPEAYPDAALRDRMLDFWSESRRLARTSGKAIEPLVLNISCKNGRVRTAEIAAISLGDLLLTSWVDLTEQKRVQDEINQRKQFLELVLNNLPDAIVTLDTQRRVVDWNPGAEKMFGYTPQEAIGRRLDQLIAGDAVFEEVGRKSTQLHAGKAVEPFETVRYHKNHSALNVIAAGSPIMRDDALTGVVVVYTDISKQRKMEDERKEYEARIQQMQKMEAIGTLAGGIAHDFNNILSGVIGYAELSLAETPQGTPLHRNLRQILSGGRRAGDLVRQILTFSRQNERELKPLQIGPMLKEALKLLRSSLPVTIQIAKYISPEVDNVMADPTQIHQIIMNLCTNAAQAMDADGGRLKVELAQEVLQERDIVTQPGIEPGSFARISVEDNGKGISPDHIGQIFNPYFTTKKTGEGTGLGLAVVHGIVQSYRGFINVESKPGKGTRFDVFIPTIETEQLLEVAEELDLPTGDEHILVVDDEEVLVDVISGILTFIGYHVTTCNSSNEALVKFAAAPADFDLVLTDMTMPDLTGIQLSNRLREIQPDIPIVLCTGYSHQLINRRPEELGLKAIVMKPIQTGELARTIRKVLDTAESGTQRVTDPRT